jgi:hypothetical protein
VKVRKTGIGSLNVLRLSGYEKLGDDLGSLG